MRLCACSQRYRSHYQCTEPDLAFISRAVQLLCHLHTYPARGVMLRKGTALVTSPQIRKEGTVSWSVGSILSLVALVRLWGLERLQK